VYSQKKVMAPAEKSDELSVWDCVQPGKPFLYCANAIVIKVSPSSSLSLNSTLAKPKLVPL
jgi:hypothetical protein